MSQTLVTKQMAAVDRLIRTVCARVADNKRVRRKLPIWGRLHIDRQLPFLCVYRRPIVPADPGTERLVTTEASYLFASAVKEQRVGLTRLVSGIVETLGREFGAFLLLELWSERTRDDQNTNTPNLAQPRFCVFAPTDDGLDSFVEKFTESLSRMKVSKQPASVDVVRSSRCSPPGLAPLLAPGAARQMRCAVLGLEVRPIYRHPDGDDLYPVVLRHVRRELTRALRRTFYDFARMHTTQRPRHFHALGRRAVVKAVWEVDRRLAEVSDSFDFLLQVTPTNSGRAWHQFRRSRFERAPVFHYRPLPVDPILLKRNLYGTPLDRVEDPTLSQLFRDKQDELDRKITMLVDINTGRFVHGSLQVFGEIKNEVKEAALELLTQLPSRTRDQIKDGQLDAEAFAGRAEAEMDRLRQLMPDCQARVSIRNDIVSTMVSGGSLLVRSGARIAAGRAAAVLEHEVGTHVLTYWNGRAQPFRLLYAGLAGYEATQEGFAVLAEYLVGGLSQRRIRQLAGRVVAARLMIDGASFIETFRELDRTYDFDQPTAFSITMRVFRGGGLTKDAIYLQGLRDVLKYLNGGGELEPLFVGKIALEHIPVIRELRHRGILQEPLLRPRYMDSETARERLALLRTGMTVLDLIRRDP